MIYIALIALNILHTKTSGLRNFFDEIKLTTPFRQRAKNEQKVVRYVIRDDSPKRRDADILSMDQTRLQSSCLVNQKGCLPDSHQRIFPFVLKIAVNVNIRIGQ